MEDNIKMIRMIADYQFGKGAGKILFPDSCKFLLSSTGKVRQIFDGNTRIATLRPFSGFFTLSIEGARRLHRFFQYPKLRVIVEPRVSKFIASGRSVFAKHVVDVDQEIRANDEVIVVNTHDELLATGRAILSAVEMLEMERGVAVKVRQGVKK